MMKTRIVLSNPMSLIAVTPLGLLSVYAGAADPELRTHHDTAYPRDLYRRENRSWADAENSDWEFRAVLNG